MLPPRILSPAERAACVSAVLARCRGTILHFLQPCDAERVVVAAEEHLAVVWAYNNTTSWSTRTALRIAYRGTRADLERLAPWAPCAAATILADVAFGPSEAPCAA